MYRDRVPLSKGEQLDFLVSKASLAKNRTTVKDLYEKMTKNS